MIWLQTLVSFEQVLCLHLEALQLVCISSQRNHPTSILVALMPLDHLIYLCSI
ncbi:hypothetical protein M758_5G017300 [Ceratodon purpureus]|nr:hypothetical protein M758_5G017300 [Ceratodon purpureus]